MPFRRRIQYQGTAPPPVQVGQFGFGSVASVEAAGLEQTIQIQFQAKTEPVFVPSSDVTNRNEDKWHRGWSEPVRQRIAPLLAVALITASGSFSPPVQPSQFGVNSASWFRPLSEPVRQKTGLAFYLQQHNAGPLLVTAPTPGTGIGGIPSTVSIGVQYETRFQYQGIAQPAFTPGIETITPDKWIYPWSEPVRHKPGLRASLQQAFIAPVLNPETQIIQGFESRWHQPWSEPVRIRPQVPAAEQQVQIQGNITPIEVVNPDKWIYPWSEPVRHKAGLRAYLQQALIAPVLNPETQITGQFESRWHQGWSEPVRLRQINVALQPSFFTAQVIAPPTPGTGIGGIPSTISVGVQYETRFQYQGATQPVLTPPTETITPDKWIYAWSEPVRQKPGLLAALQQALIAPVLNPETQIIQGFESRWHQGWSEPVRIVSRATALLPPPSITPVIAEIITLDKWFSPWREPVMPKKGIGSWFQQSFTADTVVIPITKIPGWLYPWSEPVRSKPGLAAWLQRAATPEVPVYPNLPTNLPWFDWLSEPVRLRPGVAPALQAFLFPSLSPLANVVTLTLSATEINSDRARFGLMVYNRPAKVYVSIQEIPAIRNAAASIEEEQAIRNAAVSIEGKDC